MVSEDGSRVVLVVCRANRGRSPVVAEVLRRHAEEHDLRPRPRILSSGVDARDGEPLLASVSKVLSRRKTFTLGDHESRRLRPDELSSADVVITFERTLKQAIVAQRPSVVPRTFTLRELVRLVRSPHWRPEWAGGSDVAARLHGLRPLVEPGDDNHRDPVGAGRRATRQLLDELIRDSEEIAPVLLGPARGAQHRA